MENNDDDTVGYKKPPKQHRFSATNQPTIKRKRRRRTDFGSGMLDALTQQITIKKADGTTQTLEVHEAFSKSIVLDSLKAPLAQKLKALAAMQKVGLAEVLTARAKIYADVAQLEADRREFTKEQQWARRFAELSRDEKARLKGQWYTAAAVVSEICEVVEWGDGTERLFEKASIICRAFERDGELDAQINAMIEELRVRGDPDDAENEEWEDDDADDDPDDDPRETHDPRDRRRDDTDLHDPTTDGAIEYDPSEFDESAMPVLGDVDDPALDIATGQFGAEDLTPPTSSDEEED